QAARLRDHFFETDQSFVTETVFSHHSKNDLITQAQNSGFKVILNHVQVDDSHKAFLRVKRRVLLGGHPVPEKKVHERFPRTIENLKKAVKQADLSYIWDNNQGLNPDQVSHRFVMMMNKGVIKKLSSNVPEWAKEMYREQINNFKKKRS
ncbi:MAG: zeta toxin family protein, partial [Candidatus Scalindua sp.]